MNFYGRNQTKGFYQEEENAGSLFKEELAQAGS
jgi:hypothetical protein